jgi:TetR/AcrR family transcriptional regulator
MVQDAEKEKISTILVAARRRFGHYGIAKTTMSEIASDIGMSKASLYYYFPDKEHLFVAVIRVEMDVFISEMEKVIPTSITATEKLQRYLKKRFVYFQELVNLWKVTGANHDTVKPVYASCNKEFEQRERKIIEEILQAGIASKEFSKIDVSKHAQLFVSSLQGLRVLMIKQRDSFLLTPEDYAELSEYQTLLTQVFVKGISNR